MSDGPEYAQLRARPAPRTAIEAANDRSLEHAIFAARVSSPFAVMLAVVAIGCWIWTGDARWGLTALLEAAYGGGVGWWGWWVKGNAEWRNG